MTAASTERPEGPDASSVGSVPAVDRPGRRRSGGTAASDDEVASYAAARAFLVGEWFGATLMVASFTLLYLLAFGAHARPEVIYAVCGALLLLGTLAFLRGRAYYQRIGSDIAPRAHALAAIVAGSAGIFWLLFLLLVVLASFGIALQ